MNAAMMNERQAAGYSSFILLPSAFLLSCLILSILFLFRFVILPRKFFTDISATFSVDGR
jgi:uncharacterized membrane protein YhdT